MKALILAAGQGIRLRPHTLNCPKPLLQCGPHRLIEYHLYRLAAAGFDEAVITTSYRSQDFKAHLKPESHYGLKLTFSMEPPPCFETGGGIIHALKYLDDAPFCVISGDLYTTYSFESFLDQNPEWGHVYLVPARRPHADFDLQSGLIRPNGPYFYGNMGIFHPRCFHHWPLCRVPLGKILRDLSAQNRLTGSIIDATWHNVSTPQQWAQLHNTLKTMPTIYNTTHQSS